MKQMRFHSLLLTVIAGLGMMIYGCAGVQLRTPRDIQSFEIVAAFTSSENITKAVFDSRSGTTYALVKEWQTINLYREGKKINSIGGLGSEKDNFHKLTDITLDTNGNLLALDSIEKKLKVFDSEGKWLQEIDLKSLLQPELVTMATDQTLFIYDSLAGEVVCYSALDRTDLYHFGKFQLLKPQSIACSRDHVVLYDAVANVSNIYSVLGQYVKTTPGQIIYDYYDNQVEYSNGILKTPYLDQLFRVLSPAIISIDHEYLAVAMRKDIQIVKINYKAVTR